MNHFSFSLHCYTFSPSMKSDIGSHFQSLRWRRPFRIGRIIPFPGCHLLDLAGIVPLALSHLPSLAVPSVLFM
jgi:hypothetical protein